jgi:precorrin-6A/cobalt-precorrin-6A reductase
MINQGKIWLIGGASESREIALEIVKLNLPCVVTVTTKEAKRLYPDHPLLTILQIILDPLNWEDFYQKNSIQLIIDASHPYAMNISQLAINLSTSYGLPYLRYERSSLSKAQNIVLDSIKTLLSGGYLQGKRVFLTLGYKSLIGFKDWPDKHLLYTRILPKIESLQGALKAGFLPENLIAFRPPLNYEMEKALWQHWKIQIVVTKASGKVGGEDIKQQLSQELNIPLIIIKRPEIFYPQQTDDITEVVKFLKSIYLGYFGSLIYDGSTNNDH